MSSSEKRTLNIPIDEWIRLMDSGACAPAVVTPTGNSMWPMIRSGRDTIEVHPVDKQKIKPGDVVLFRRSDNQAVVHRVYRLTEDRVQTWGDNCMGPDAPVPYGSVFGIVTKVHRGPLTLNPYVAPPVINSFRKMLQSVKRIKRKICTAL